MTHLLHSKIQVSMRQHHTTVLMYSFTSRRCFKCWAGQNIGKIPGQGLLWPLPTPKTPHTWWYKLTYSHLTSHPSIPLNSILIYISVFVFLHIYVHLHPQFSLHVLIPSPLSPICYISQFFNPLISTLFLFFCLLCSPLSLKLPALVISYVCTSERNLL